MKNSASCYLVTFLFVFWLILNLPPLIKSQCADNTPCFPPVIDAAKLPAFNLTINSTCGTPAEDFCVSTDCSLVCDASNPSNAHPPSHIIDSYELTTYWKSKNFDEPVFIRIDFGTKLLLHQISITFPFEVLPNGLYIERSQDGGKTYFVLAYYAIRCNDTFNLPTSTRYDGIKVLCFALDPASIQKLVIMYKFLLSCITLCGLIFVDNFSDTYLIIRMWVEFCYVFTLDRSCNTALKLCVCPKICI